MSAKKTSPWYLWPFVTVWDLLALALNITGRVLAALSGVCLMIVGIGLTMTVAGAPIPAVAPGGAGDAALRPGAPAALAI